MASSSMSLVFLDEEENKNDASRLSWGGIETHNSLIVEDSHEASGACSQPTQEIMTQNLEWSQFGEGDDENGEHSAFSPLPPGRLSPLHVNEREQPWGRLLPSSSNQDDMCANYSQQRPIELLPRSPERRPLANLSASSQDEDAKPANQQEPSKTTQSHSCEKDDGFSILGLSKIHASDLFNEHFMGRSKKMDIAASEPIGDFTSSTGTPTPDSAASIDAKKIKAMHEWAHAMISNKHCRIYCRLDETIATNPPSSVALMPPPQVYIEDCSGNGTLINRTIVLRKGERRILHSGDEVCLANPAVLQRKIPSQTVLQQVMQQHSFVFVNLLSIRMSAAAQTAPQSQVKTAPLGPSIQGNVAANRQQLFPGIPSAAHDGVGKRVKAAVNVRALKHPSMQQKSNHFNPMARHVEQKGSDAPQAQNHDRNIQKERRFEEDYDLRDMLGSGTVGQVFRAIHRKTGQERAVKRIPWTGGLPSRQFMNRGQYQNDQQDQQHPWQAEAAILQKLNHPYIVDLIDVYVNTNALYIVMELLPGGDLFDRIVARERYSETASRRVLRRILSAVHYLHHGCNIVHRDLKPENILLVGPSNDIHIKITDFGLAKTCESGGLKTFCGTPQYFAPEVLQRQLTVAGKGFYGKPADMWSVGVILYVLLSGTPPFQEPPSVGDNSGGPRNAENDNSLHSFRFSNHRPVVDFPEEFWHDVSDTARDLVRRLLMPDPKRRFTVEQACRHSWILVEDGDTHISPLEDPKLAGIVKPASTPCVESDRPSIDALKGHAHGKNAQMEHEQKESETSDNARLKQESGIASTDDQLRPQSYSSGVSSTVNASTNESSIDSTKDIRRPKTVSDEIDMHESRNSESMESGQKEANVTKVTPDDDSQTADALDHEIHKRLAFKAPPNVKEQQMVSGEESERTVAKADQPTVLSGPLFIPPMVKQNTNGGQVNSPNSKKSTMEKMPVSGAGASESSGGTQQQKRAPVKGKLVNDSRKKERRNKPFGSSCLSSERFKKRPQKAVRRCKPGTQTKGEESASSRRVSDASSESKSTANKMAPLTPKNVNGRPQAFRLRLIEQAKSETKSRKKQPMLSSDKTNPPTTNNGDDGNYEDDIESQFSTERPESIHSSPESVPPPAPDRSASGGKENKPAFRLGETRSKRRKMKGQVTEEKKPKKSRRRYSNGTDASTNKGGKKQTTLSAWCLPDEGYNI